MIAREFTAKTTQEAIDTGLAELGVTIADVRVDVLQEGAKGLFGLFGSKPARVRITVMEEPKEETLGIRWSIDEEKPAKEERPVKKDKKQHSEPKKEEKKPQTEKTAAEKPRNLQPKKNTDAPEAVKGKAEPDTKKETAEAVVIPAPAADESTVKEKRQPKEHRTRPAKQKQERTREAMAPAEVFHPTEPPVIYPENTPAGCAQHFLMNLTEKMGVKVDVYVDENQENALSIRLIGDTLGILIGRRGETLDAIQYLTSLQVNKGKEDYIRVVLDTENYRAKREDSLHRLAVRMANRAQKTGRRVVMEPMNPYERRVMHTALQDHPAVTTHSEGEEPNRRVVITLKAQGEPQTNAAETDDADAAEQKPKRKRNHRRSRKPRAKGEKSPSAETTVQTETPVETTEA